ncbi:extracellular solute-binding protein [Patescibacteria group bacterium]|nr:extracellular solute-binding protein [Patescibacteria group bacterium]
MTKRVLIILLAALMVFAAFGFKNCGGDKGEAPPEPITLQYWRVFDDSDVFEPFIAEYQQLHPHITIEYKKLTFTEYEQKVTDGLASSKGPDMWSIHNTWLPKHESKLDPLPEDLLSLPAYSDTYVDVVTSDFVADNRIYGFPLSMDTLALYYNKDMLNSAFIVEPPANWTELIDAVEKITQIDSVADVEVSGAALGTASNINRAPDILSLLMLQNGTEMIDPEQGIATFNRSKETSTGTYFPGLDALTFYTDFANPRKPVYTWTPTMPHSVDAFIEEKTAMMFSYSYQDEIIKSKAPKMNVGVAPMPQIADTPKEVNYANYWGEVVSKSSEHKAEAWDFLMFLAKKEQNQKFVEATNRPAARKDIIKEQVEDPFLRVFAEQTLTAKSWYQPEAAKVEAIFNNMIDSVVLGEAEPEDALNTANQQVSALME